MFTLTVASGWPLGALGSLDIFVAQLARSRAAVAARAVVSFVFMIFFC
jgi:hypothetical protein